MKILALTLALCLTPALAAAAIVADVTWTDNSTTEDGFRIYRAVPPAAETLVGTVAAGVVTWTDPGPLTAGTQYCYHVAAYNALGEAARVAGDQGCALTIDVPAGATGVNVNIRVQ